MTQMGTYEWIEFNRHSFALKIIPVPQRKKSVDFTANVKWSVACLCYVQYLYVKTSQGIAGQNLWVVKLATWLQRNLSRTLRSYMDWRVLYFSGNKLWRH